MFNDNLNLLGIELEFVDKMGVGVGSLVGIEVGTSVSSIPVGKGSSVIFRRFLSDDALMCYIPTRRKKKRIIAIDVFFMLI